MTIKTEDKDHKVKCSLECRIHSYRQSLQKYSAGATNLIKSKLGLTKQSFKHNARLSGIFDFQMMNDINREAEYMNELKTKVEHLKVKQAKKQKKLEKKKVKGKERKKKVRHKLMAKQFA